MTFTSRDAAAAPTETKLTCSRVIRVKLISLRVVTAISDSVLAEKTMSVGVASRLPFTSLNP
jgi:hypothetical protein